MSYGLKVISADGATVIIDGTSNMFKIVATGTLSMAGPDATSAPAQTSASATIATGLTTTPAYTAFIVVAGNPQELAYLTENLTFDGLGHVDDQKFFIADWETGNQTRIRHFWNAWDNNRSGSTSYVRYYLFQEVAF